MRIKKNNDGTGGRKCNDNGKINDIGGMKEGSMDSVHRATDFDVKKVIEFVRGVKGINCHATVPLPVSETCDLRENTKSPKTCSVSGKPVWTLC